MAWIDVGRTVDAPVERVFQRASDIRRFSESFRHIMSVEYLTDTAMWLGIRFRETRLTLGRDVTTELEVTEYVENERIRIVADCHGTSWDTLITVTAGQGATELKVSMEARAYELLPKLMNPLIRGIIRRGVELDLLFVKGYCEKTA